MGTDRLTLLLQELTRVTGLSGPQVMAGLLVLGSMLLYCIAANLAWYYGAHPAGRLSRSIRPLVDSPFVRLLYEIVRLGYYVVLPFFALIAGLVDLRTMGFAYLDWADGIRWAIVLGLASWSLLMFVWVPYLRATAGLAKKQAWGLTPGRRVIEVVYMQAHWALYRAACIMILSSFFTQELAVYWGTCAGIALVALEAWSDPRLRRQVAILGEGEFTLWSASQAIINSVGFVLTHNTWLLSLLHLILEFTVPHLRPAPRPAPVRASRPEAAPTNRQDTPA